jgi:hypothetical protein
MDAVLHAERLDGRGKRTHRCRTADLPDGAMIARDGVAYAVRGDGLLRWSPDGYAEKIARPAHGEAELLTPPAMVAALSAGYVPQWHARAQEQ